MDLFASVDESGGREVGSRNDLYQLIDRDLRLLDQSDRGVKDLRQIMRRDLRRHSDGDSFRTVYEQIRKPRRHNLRLGKRIVVVRLEIDSFFLDVGEHFVRQLFEADFGVTHRCGIISVDRAEIPLAIDKRISQRKILGESHNRVVNGRIAMRMILTDRVSDDTGRLLIRLVISVAKLVHRPEHTAMDRLQAVADIRQRTSDDDGHCIIEIRSPHLVFDIDLITF
jgi:hypothetical protein